MKIRKMKGKRKEGEWEKEKIGKGDERKGGKDGKTGK